SLKVDYADPGNWKADFTLPFAGTKLAEVLKLDQPEDQRPTLDQLARYTLRYDVIYPDRNDNAEPQWEVTQPFAFNGSTLPIGQARRDAPAGRVQTISFTLDQMPSWDANAEGAPVMVFIAQGDFDATGNFTLYYDNFRLIDTGGAAVARPHIDSIKVNAQGKVVITWTGAGSLQSTPGLLGTPQWTTIQGATSGAPIDPPASGIAFYRVQGQ